MSLEDVTDLVPINPPQRKSIELWKAMAVQCSLIAAGSIGPDEKELMKQNSGPHPSETQRMKETTKR